jgi:uncharacterized protein
MPVRSLPTGVCATTIWAALVLNAWGAQPSFDCVTNTAPDERTICANSGLAELDIQASSLYFSLRDTLGAPQKILLRDAQRYWLKRRAACGANASCIARLYRARIPELNAMLAGTPSGRSSSGGGTPLPSGTPEACNFFPTLC